MVLEDFTLAVGVFDPTIVFEIKALDDGVFEGAGEVVCKGLELDVFDSIALLVFIRVPGIVYVNIGEYVNLLLIWAETLRAEVLVDVLLAVADMVGFMNESTNILPCELFRAQCGSLSSQLSACVKRIKRRVLFILSYTMAFCP